jgi:hypothetical protein
MPTGQLAANTSDTLDTRQLLKVLMAVKKGDFSLRMPVEHTGVAGKIADTLNDIIDLNQHMTDEFARISTVEAKRAASHSARRLARPAARGAPASTRSIH